MLVHWMSYWAIVKDLFHLCYDKSKCLKWKRSMTIMACTAVTPKFPIWGSIKNCLILSVSTLLNALILSHFGWKRQINKCNVMWCNVMGNEPLTALNPSSEKRLSNHSIANVSRSQRVNNMSKRCAWSCSESDIRHLKSLVVSFFSCEMD